MVVKKEGSLNIMQFAEKAWYTKNWIATEDRAYIKKKYLENQRKQKRYFILKYKLEKNGKLSPKEESELRQTIYW